MLRILFLILIMFSFTAFAQTEENVEMPEAVKITEFGNVPNGQIRLELDNFFVHLQNDPSATGYIVNFGSAREVARVEKLIRSQIRLRRFDSSRVVFINGGKADELLTQFWLVPAGAEPPTP